jgi:hypothetical protein
MCMTTPDGKIEHYLLTRTTHTRHLRDTGLRLDSPVALVNIGKRKTTRC